MHQLTVAEPELEAPSPGLIFAASPGSKGEGAGVGDTFCSASSGGGQAGLCYLRWGRQTYANLRPTRFRTLLGFGESREMDGWSATHRAGRLSGRWRNAGTCVPSEKSLVVG